jgi:V/A-type H+-transporting ATPase subunit D
MAKVKLTKGELKRQRDALRQYERYLPTLLLKKQQLQLEILQQSNLLIERNHLYQKKKESILHWSGLLSESPAGLKVWIRPSRVVSDTRNVAGVELPVFQKVEFFAADYDLFSTALWVDFAIEALCGVIQMEKEIEVIEEGLKILRQELRITTQRVNLFEKIKIPEAREAIRLIKIYIGDQMANAVGRSKIAKGKIEELQLQEAAA